ncbi:nitrite reductase [Skermanella stibiiresistens SB22]|uniref:Nitrite reductase n=1 Tax=Skermanella stibiiresistens SB22 TaxID=1385369 RepID=W9H6C9_9PROT|nr:nitrite reductase [Skermanella stibiiresistens SB22]
MVVVGNGMAAIRTVEDVLAAAPDLYRVTVFGAEPHGHYNRILLSSVLAGDAAVTEIVTHPPAWYARNGITLHTGDRVTAIDPVGGTVRSASGRELAWDRLILATGAVPVVPDIPGGGLEGVRTFRDIGDVERMIEASERHRRAVVIGGGVLGLEAAWGLRRRGMEVSVVHLMPSLMERQLDDTAAGLLLRELDGRGIGCVTGSQAVALTGEERVTGVLLSDGRRIEADLVVFTVGIRPETTLARAAGLAVGRGVLVGDDMRTSHPGIYAVGECVEHDGQCFGLVAPLWDMAGALADQLTDAPVKRRFAPPIVPTSLKIPGIDIFSAGRIQAANDAEREIVHHDPANRVYRKLVLCEGRVVGAVLYGDLCGSGRFLGWMRDGTDLGAGLDLLAPDEGSDGEVVCHCHDVTRGAITAAVEAHGLTTLEQVGCRTRAGTGCGQCRGAVTRVLADAAGTADGAKAVDAATRRAARMRLGFRVWHHANAALMAVLLLTGISLHFPGTPVAVVEFGWSHRLHEWSGLALCGAYAVFLGLCLVFRRKFGADAQGAAMFVAFPLVVASGLTFLWPGLLPDRAWSVSALVPVAVAHSLLAVSVVMFLIQHLSHAPWAWWRKRGSRRRAL